MSASPPERFVATNNDARRYVTMSTTLAGKAQTVLGPVNPDALGVTLSHEHCFMDLSVRFIPPVEASLSHMANQPVSWDNLWYVRYHPTGNVDNLQLGDEAVMTEEVARFKTAGGGTIVDMTNIGLARDPLALARLSRTTGVNLIMGSGYYVEPSVPGGLGMSEDEMVDVIVRDVTEGVETTGVRAGLIGEIGCSWPTTPNEFKSLRAAARAQRLTGAPVNIHPGFSPESPFQALTELEKSGADLSHVAMSHVEARIFDHAQRVALARTGCMLEFDLFGVEGYQPIRMVYAEHNPMPAHMPNDGSRVEMIMALIGEGFGDRILMSHDICWKTRLCRYGGPGYVHILNNAVPLMRSKGMDEETIRQLLVDNPRRFLTFV
jgi:phosphotriesterase-related protein